MLPLGMIFKLKIHRNTIVAGALPLIPLGELTNAFSKLLPPAPAERQGRGRKGEVREREGGAFTHFFFYNLTTDW